MKPQHGGWSSQAKRRGEEYLACVDCGQPKHPRTLRQAEPEHEESFVAQLAVAFLLFAALYVLALVAAGVQA